MGRFLWSRWAKIIPLSCLAVYEIILVGAKLSFDDHLLIIGLAVMSFLTWPDDTHDETPDGPRIIGYRPLPAPFDLIMSVVLLLIAGIATIASLLLHVSR